MVGIFGGKREKSGLAAGTRASANTSGPDFTLNKKARAK
jgi:hypothetical protein